MIELDDIAASVDSILAEYTEGALLKRPPKQAVIAKAPTVRPVRPWRPVWHSEALILVTHSVTCACGERYTSPAGLLVRFRHRDGKTLWETNEHVAAHRPDIPREERILRIKTLYCHKCFEPAKGQREFDLQLWPTYEPLGLEEREALDSTVTLTLE